MKRIGTLNGKTIVETSDLNTLKDNEVAIRYDGDKLTLLERKDNGEIVEIVERSGEGAIKLNNPGDLLEQDNYIEFLDNDTKALAVLLLNYALNYTDDELLCACDIKLPSIEFKEGDTQKYIPMGLRIINNDTSFLVNATFASIIFFDSDGDMDGLEAIHIKISKDSSGYKFKSTFKSI